MGVIEGVAVGLALYALSATLFSRAAGLLAAGAWLATPLAVGFGHISSVDLAFALAVVAAALALVRHLRAPTWRTLTVLALAAGALQLTRHTGFLYVAVICAALVVRRWRDGGDAARDVAVVLVATWALVWVATLAVAPTRVAVGERDDETGAVAGVLSEAVEVVPWPAEYEAGFQTQLAASAADTQGFLFGDMWWGARPAFWPLAMVVKLPITVVALMIAGPLGWLRLNGDQRRLAALVAVRPSWPPSPSCCPTTSRSASATRCRASSCCSSSPRRSRWACCGAAGLAVLAGAVIAQLAFLWGSAPHSLAWTAPPFRPGYQVVSESNLDWGQDGYRLAEWMEGRTGHVSYFGGASAVDRVPGFRP